MLPATTNINIRKSAQFPVLILLLLFAGCKGRSGVSYDQKESFPVDSLIISDRLTITGSGLNIKIIITDPWQGARNIKEEYTLVRHGSPIPEGADSSSVIFVPVRNIVCMSTTHVAMIEALGEQNTISGISGTDFVFSEKVRNLVVEGRIRDVGYEGNLNNELLLNLKPDIVILYGVSNEAVSQVTRLEDLNIKVLMNPDFLETDPLKKLSWIRLFGALYCKESIADSILKAETKEYNRIRTYISSLALTKPAILLGLPYRDTWFVSPGNSFAGRLISDAGGEYLWSDSKSDMSMPMSLENVFVKAINADFWLNTGSASYKEEILTLDKRLGELPCFKAGNVFNNNRRISTGGGNDYWESGALHPSVVLKDIASIIHPGIFGPYKPFYYTQVN